MKRSLIALALAAVLPLSANAGELSYTYVEGNYNNIDFGGGFEGDGFGLRGSFNFGSSDFYGFGAYSWNEIDGTSIDVNPSEFGFGYHYGLTDNADLIAELAYVDISTDFGDEDGYRASVGVRGSFSDNFEGFIKANYVDLDFDDDVTASIGVQYKFNQTWGITAEGEFGDLYDSYLVGVRASF